MKMIFNEETGLGLFGMSYLHLQLDQTDLDNPY